MNKKLFVLLTIVAVLMMPSIVSAQTEPCNVLYLGHYWNMADNQLLIGIEVQHAYSVNIDVIIDGVMMEFHTILFDGGIHLWEIKTYIPEPYIGQQAFEIVLFILAFDAEGQVAFDDMIGFNIIIMQQMEIVPDTPDETILVVPVYDPIEYNYDILAQTFGVILFMAWAVCIIGGLLKPTKKRRKVNRFTHPSKSVKDTINTETLATLDCYGNPAKPSEAQIMEDHLQKQMEQQIEAIHAAYNDIPQLVPRPEAIMLPDLSNEEDGYDWRTCPYCGEWNNGKATRCNHCDGKLGRPLG